MPRFPIVDSHVHFWDDATVPIGWTRTVEPMNRPYGLADYDEDRGDVAVEAIVFVEADVDPGHHLAEADRVAELAATEPRLKAIVAHAPLHEAGDVAPDLARLAERPLVRGVRTLLQDKDAAALCHSPAFRGNVRALADHDLHFEICVLHHQLADAIALVEACPDVRFVLDHIGKPGIAAGLNAPWSTEIGAMAALPNVDCKISGVATEADHAGWDEATLLPYVERALTVFGPSRVLFGSDWPVMRLAIDLPRWVEIVDRAVASWDEADRRRLFAENARRVYRL